MKPEKKSTALVTKKSKPNSFPADRLLRGAEIYTNFFEIKFSSGDIYKYSAEMKPEELDARKKMSILSFAMRRNKEVIREKFGDGYVFNNFAIYSKKGADKVELKVTFDEQEYTITCRQIRFILALFLILSLWELDLGWTWLLSWVILENDFDVWLKIGWVT